MPIHLSFARLFTAFLALAPAPLAAQPIPEVEFHFNYRPGSFAALERSIANVSLVVPEWYIVDGEGRLTGEAEPRLLELARAHGVPVMVQVKNLDRAQGLFRADWARALLNDPAARARAIARLVEVSREHRLYGVQLELEGVHVDDRDALTRFVREAGDALRAAGFRLSVSAIHREEEGPGPNSYTAWMWEHWRGVYDLAGLADGADFVRAVVYAQHTRRTPPGPSQSLPWLERVMAHFTASVPPEKLVLGVGMGVSHWFTVADPALYHLGARSWSRGVTRADAQALLDAHGGAPFRWNDREKMASAHFERAGVMEWLVSDNDVRAFDAKLELARRLGLRGVSMWVGGDEEPGIWSRFRARRLAGGGAAAATRAFGGIPVLAWHNFVDEAYPGMGPLTDTFDRLEELLVWMRAEGFESVFTEEARVPGLAGRRQVILTFDDGRREHLRAARLLERHGYRGIFFVIPGRTAHASETYLTYADLEELVRGGHRVAVHGYDHRSLAFSGSETVASLLSAHARLGAGGTPPSTVEFAFPFGHYTTAVAGALAERYRYLMTVNPGYWDGGSTLVPRILIFRDTPLSFYRAYLQGAAAHEAALRPLTPDGSVASELRFRLAPGVRPERIELLAISPDREGRNYAVHPLGTAMRVEGGEIVVDLRAHRDRFFPESRNVIGLALVERDGDRVRYLTDGLTYWLEDPVGGPRLTP
jgi:spore germination protein YaaH/peptidoglycan/xylan/chitin deacetylase (PgdA/CDA1 family)